MSTAFRIALGLGLALTTWRGVANAGEPMEAADPAAVKPVCESLDRPLAIPLTVSWQDADLFAARAVCPRSGGALRAGASLLVATRDFYGAVRVGARLDGRLQLKPDIAVTATLDFLQWQFVQNATINDSRLALGQMTLGALVGRFETHGFSFVPSVRILLPTSTRYTAARSLALDPALMFGGSFRRWLDFYGSFGYAVWATASTEAFHIRGGPTLTAGLAFVFNKRVSASIQLDGLGKVGADAVLRRVALSAGAHVRLGKGFRLELAVGRVFAGTDVTDLNAGLTVSYHDG